MGYMRHHAIVVTYHDSEEEEAQSIWRILKRDQNSGALVSDIAYSGFNGYGSFFIAPDGSKEGWSESHTGDEFRKTVKRLVRDIGATWVEVQYGDDNGETKVVDDSTSSAL